MKANKRVRDPRRRSKYRLVYIATGIKVGVTTFPTLANKVRRTLKPERSA